MNKQAFAGECEMMARLKTFIKESWETPRGPPLVCGLIAVVAVLVIGLIGIKFFLGFLGEYNDYFAGISTGVNAIVVAVLVGVTIVYARATNKMAEATREQAEASVKMAEAAFRPIIAIDWIGPWPDTKENTSAVFENIGVGPASNLQCYFTHPQFNFQYKDDAYTVMSIEEKHTISLRHENFDKERAGLAINCDYQSISGKNFRSILRFKTDEERQFEILETKVENKQ